MPAKSRREDRLPRLCERKSQATGRAIYYATIGGRFVSYGGDRAAARKAHEANVARWLAHGRRHDATGPTDEPYLVEELVADYYEHAQTYYRDPVTGRPNGEYSNLVLALDPVAELFGSLPAAEFGGVALRTVREKMIEGGRLCRREINARVHRIRRAFRWAVSHQKVPESVVGTMMLVEGLKAGRTTARESAPVLPVTEQEVRAVTAHLCPTVAGLVWFQWWTGCRPGEACALRWGMIDRTGPVWIVELERHKTAHRGRRRMLAIGPRAQEAIRGLQVLDPAAFVFSPRRALAEQRQAKRAARQSKVPPSQQIRADLARRAPREEIAEAFTVHTLRRAIARGVRAANAELVRDRMLEVLERVLGDGLAPQLRDQVARLSIERCVTEGGSVKLTKERLQTMLDDEAAAGAVAEALGKLELFSAWGPNRLRHSAATRLRREEGLEAARVCLGHARAAVTEIYAEADHLRSQQIMLRHG